MILLSSGVVIANEEKNVHKLGQITIDADNKTVSFPVDINQRRGFIEYILVGGEGKLHEALLKSSVNILQLNAALKLIRLKKGDAIDITASWSQFGKDYQQPIHEWMKYNEDQVIQAEWVYIGSAFSQNGQFIAAINEDIISIKDDETALIAYRGKGYENENLWSAFYKQIPLIESVTFTIAKKTTKDLN